MRRWMIVLAIAGLFIALVAAPGAAKKEPPLEKQELHLAEQGETTFGAVEVWTGDPAGNIFPKGPIKGIAGWYALMDPTYNTCDVAVSMGDEPEKEWTSLTWTGKNTAILKTYEVNCPMFLAMMPRVHTRVAHITPSGAVTLSGDPHPFFPPDEDGNHWLVKASGCGLNGTFPVYHGTFDFKTGELHAETHFHGICDEGAKWGTFFGIGKEDGPLHATFTIDLTFDMGE